MRSAFAAEVFSPAFRELLRSVMHRCSRVRGGRIESSLRAKRKLPAAGGSFRGHRAYAPGDDLRRVDWNAFARTGDLFTKVFEEEDRRALTVCVDVTPSMLAGQPPRAIGALRLAALLAGVGWMRLDAVRVLVGGAEVGVLSFEGPVRADALMAGLLDAWSLQPQQPSAARAGSDRGGAESRLANVAAEHALGPMVWVSDFADPEAVRPALQRLRRHTGGRVRGLLPAIPDDREPPAKGWLRIVDPETGREESLLVDPAMRAAVTSELRRLERQQEAVFAEVGFPLLRFPLPDPDDFRLSSWLDRRWSTSI